MVAVPLKRVDVLRGILWLTTIERAEALASGDRDLAALKDETAAQLEHRLAALERQAEDELAAQMLQ